VPGGTAFRALAPFGAGSAFPLWFVQFIYSLFHFFGLSSQHHACRFLGIRVFDSAPPFGCGRAGAGFLAGFFDFFSACPVFAWFLAFCKAEAERQF
jgi:hypothetical protein